MAKFIEVNEKSTLNRKFFLNIEHITIIYNNRICVNCVKDEGSMEPYFIDCLETYDEVVEMIKTQTQG